MLQEFSLRKLFICQEKYIHLHWLLLILSFSRSYIYIHAAFVGFFVILIMASQTLVFKDRIVQGLKKSVDLFL